MQCAVCRGRSFSPIYGATVSSRGAVVHRGGAVLGLVCDSCGTQAERVLEAAEEDSDPDEVGPRDGQGELDLYRAADAARDAGIATVPSADALASATRATAVAASGTATAVAATAAAKSARSVAASAAASATARTATAHSSAAIPRMKPREQLRAVQCIVRLFAQQLVDMGLADPQLPSIARKIWFIFLHFCTLYDSISAAMAAVDVSMETLMAARNRGTGRPVRATAASVAADGEGRTGATEGQVRPGRNAYSERQRRVPEPQAQRTERIDDFAADTGYGDRAGSDERPRLLHRPRDRRRGKAGAFDRRTEKGSAAAHAARLESAYGDMAHSFAPIDAPESDGADVSRHAACTDHAMEAEGRDGMGFANDPRATGGNVESDINERDAAEVDDGGSWGEDDGNSDEAGGYMRRSVRKSQPNMRSDSCASDGGSRVGHATEVAGASSEVGGEDGAIASQEGADVVLEEAIDNEGGRVVASEAFEGDGADIVDDGEDPDEAMDSAEMASMAVGRMGGEQYELGHGESAGRKRRKIDASAGPGTVRSGPQIPARASEPDAAGSVPGSVHAPRRAPPSSTHWLATSHMQPIIQLPFLITEAALRWLRAPILISDLYRILYLSELPATDAAGAAYPPLTAEARFVLGCVRDLPHSAVERLRRPFSALLQLNIALWPPVTALLSRFACELGLPTALADCAVRFWDRLYEDCRLPSRGAALEYDAEAIPGMVGTSRNLRQQAARSMDRPRYCMALLVFCTKLVYGLTPASIDDIASTAARLGCRDGALCTWRAWVRANLAPRSSADVLRSALTFRHTAEERYAVETARAIWRTGRLLADVRGLEAALLRIAAADPPPPPSGRAEPARTSAAAEPMLPLRNDASRRAAANYTVYCRLYDADQPYLMLLDAAASIVGISPQELYADVRRVFKCAQQLADRLQPAEPPAEPPTEPPTEPSA